MSIDRTSLLMIGAITLALSAAGAFAYLSYSKRLEDERLTFRDAQTETSRYQNLEGEAIDLRDFSGSILVVTTWASWSPLSRDELIELAQIKKEFGDGIQIIAINRNEPVAQARAYIESLGDDVGGIQFLLDGNDQFYASVDGYAMPETILYDPSGVLIEHIRGTINRTTFRERISTLLSEKDTLW